MTPQPETPAEIFERLLALDEAELHEDMVALVRVAADPKRDDTAVAAASVLVGACSCSWPLSILVAPPVFSTAVGTWELEFLPHEPPGPGTPAGVAAGALAAGFGGKGELHTLVRAVEAQLHGSLYRAAREPGSPVSVEGEAALVLADVPGARSHAAVVDALLGKHDETPKAIARRVASTAEKARRWRGQRGKHARGEVRLVHHPVALAKAVDPSSSALTSLIFAELEREANEALTKADALEAAGKVRSAQRVRTALYRRLGGRGRAPSVKR